MCGHKIVAGISHFDAKVAATHAQCLHALGDLAGQLCRGFYTFAGQLFCAFVVTCLQSPTVFLEDLQPFVGLFQCRQFLA